MNINTSSSSELSLAEAAELVAEVRMGKSTSQAGIGEFAGLLGDLISLRTNTSEEEPGEALERFIFHAIDELKTAVEADSPNMAALEVLEEQAVDQWGEQLLVIRDAGEDAWQSETAASDDLAVEDENLEAPSQDAVQAILSQLGAHTEVPSEAPVADHKDSYEEKHSLASNEPVSVTIESLAPELREAFLDDAVSCLGSIENSLLKLESNPQDRESLKQILRELHTLKGASASVGMQHLADQIHDIEEGLREDESAGRAPSVDALLHCVDELRTQVGDAESPPADVSTQVKPTGQTRAASPVFSDDGSDDDLVRVKSSQLNRLMDMLAELVMLRNKKESELLELQEVYHELISSVSKMRLLGNESDLRAETSKSLQLSEVANDVLETAQHLRDCTRPFVDGNAAVSRFIRQFRQELVELRRTPISGLFRRLQRVARDASRAEAKQVRLAMVGEDAGIERALQQRIYEPLLHIVRNSVCHGIEGPEERRQAGKPEEGVVSLEAKSGPDLFVVEVRDDGRGLDYEAIRRRGVERGLLSADQVVSREELAQLIFQPGFSTREEANQVGGRGVGMDVVAATLQRMRGWLEVESEPGLGTRIRLSFPLPSVVQHAMVFRSADQLFALPMESVQAAGESSEDIAQHRFCELLGLESNTPLVPNQSIVIAGNDRLAQSGKASPLALLVEEILGPEELVVRPLPSLLKNHPFCAGASLSGMGQTVVLLDPRRVLQTYADRVEGEYAEPRSESESVPAARSLRKRLKVLVVDDSISARKRVVRSLGRYPLDIVEATNGKEALEVLKAEPIVAVFSDMEMPHLDGMDLLEEIHSPDRKNPPPVVIISSRYEADFIERARELGATDYLAKPLKDEELDKALSEIDPLRHLAPESPFPLEK